MAVDASSSMSRFTYHVFLSFRGEDTRKNFTDHLYTALVNAGLHTFRDDDEIERGGDIKSELDRAIKQSRSSVVVLSKDYASSGWCLDELVMIVERNRTDELVLFPVFYDVDPSCVRNQTGSVGKAFDEHKKRFEAETDERKKKHLREKMEGWRAALREVADLGRFVLQNQDDRHESKFIQIVVREVVSKLDLKVLSATPYPTGLESRVKYINSCLKDGSNNPHIMVINGMGGIGKTTIAKTIYNQNFDRFEGSSFLANIRETAKEPNGLVRLQRQLVSDILKWKMDRIYNVDQGAPMIKDALSCKRVLVVLDDVDHSDQVKNLVGFRDQLHPGSKIVVTTRYEQLLKADEVFEITVEELNDDEALCLFSRHAFGQHKPTEQYTELSKRVVQYCGGLPLALQSLGSSLCGETVDVWESQLAKLTTHLPEKIHNVLKMSYDPLDDHEKNLFLDIVCFFVGKDKDYMLEILKDCYYPITVSFQNLIRRGLVKVTKKNKLLMHQLLREMGREIIRQQSRKQPGKRSRLWYHEDVFNVLRDKTGTEKIEGLSLNMDDLIFKSSKNAQETQFEGFPAELILLNEENSRKRYCRGLLSWFPIVRALVEPLSEPDEANLKTDAFSPMRNLRLLQLNNVRLTGGYKEFPKRLRWLCWRGCSLKYIPSEFPLERLVVLDMRNSCLERLCKSTMVLMSLKILDLSYSYHLASSPDFSQLPNLERLILKHCKNLSEIHKSIGELGRLVLLNLKGCENLRNLPKKVFQLKSLEKLNISGCSRLEGLPPDLGNLVLLNGAHVE